METAAFIQGRNAFRPGWTNHTEHTPYNKGTPEYEQFKAGWNSQADHSEYGLDIE